MPKVRIIIRPSGLLNGREWPEVGESIELPDVVADDMESSGHVERITAKPAAKAADKPAAKTPRKRAAKKVETRPAKGDGVETRKG